MIRRGMNAAQLHAYVEGYWDGWHFALTHDDEEVENEDGTAPGSADAPGDLLPDLAAPSEPPPSADAPAGTASSRSQDRHSLPAMRQGAAPSEGEGDA